MPGRWQEARIPLYHASGSLHRDYHHISARHQRLIFLPVRLSFSPSSFPVAFNGDLVLSLALSLACLLPGYPRLPSGLPAFPPSLVPSCFFWFACRVLPSCAARGFGASEKWPFVNYSPAAFLWPRYLRWRWKRRRKPRILPGCAPVNRAPFVRYPSLTRLSCIIALKSGWLEEATWEEKTMKNHETKCIECRCE